MRILAMGHWAMLGMFCLCACLCPAWATTTLRVGIYQNSPKVAWSAQGRAEGIFVDVLEAVARSEGWTLEYVPGTWSEGLARLEQGQIDLMPDVARTTEREALYAFHEEPVLASWNQVYTRRSSQVRTLLDLADKRVAVLAGSVQERQLSQMAASFSLVLQWLPVADFDAAFQAVQDGNADAVVTNRFYGVRNAARFGLEDTAIIFSPSKLFFASRKGTQGEVLAAMDRHLVAFKQNADSVYFRSLRQWSIDEVRTASPGWLWPVGSAALALLISGMVWVFVLRRQVALRTTLLRSRNAEIETINQTLRAIGSQRDISAVLDEATKGALALTSFDGGVLCVRDAVVGTLGVGSRVNAMPATDRAADGHGLCDGNCPAMLEAVTKGRSYVLLAADDAAAAKPCGNVRDPSVRWNAYFPLRIQERTIGVLCLFSRQAMAPGAHQLALVEDLCGPVALAMENARLYRQTQEHAQELEQRVRARTAEMAELSAFLQAIIDHIANPIFYKGADLRFRGCNRAYETTFGVNRTHFLGRTVLDLAYLPEADRLAYQAEDAAVLAGGTTVQREAVIPFADGKPHQTLYSVAGFCDAQGAAAGVVGVIVDITTIKEVQAALRSVNEEQAAIFEAANFGIALIQDRTVRRCNRRLESMLGYVPGTLQGQSTRAWYPSEEAYQQGGEPVVAHVARGETHQRELQLVRQGAGLLWCRITVRALDLQDLARGVVAVVEDITAERAATQALLQAKEAAETADRIKSAFLATMSHELRTPLNSIIGFTGIVLQELAGPLNAEQGKQLGMVRDSARHLLALINDVLDISKIEAGELRVERAPFALTESVQKVIGIVQPLADKKMLSLQWEVANGVESMTSDVRRVEQVLLNLLSNAIKFTEKGWVRLSVQRPDAASVLLQVQDSGMGIQKEDLATLFTPFRQLDSELSRKHEGTGLGLAICRRLAELMGGTIHADSIWGQGSTFTVTLPVQAPERTIDP